MDLVLSEELQLLGETARRFVDDQFIPLEREFGDGPLPNDVRAALVAKVQDIGFWAAAAPAALGGGELGAMGQGVLLTETGRSILDGCMAATTIFGGAPPEPLLHAGPELTDRLVRPIVAGTRTVAFAPPGPIASASLRYRRDGDALVVDGRQTHVEGWARADAVLLLADGDRSLTYVAADRDTPGLTEVETTGLLSGTAADVTTLDLVGVRLPLANIIGDLGGAAALTETWRAAEGLRTCCRLIGLVERGARMARDYAKQRVTFGQPLSNRQAIQWKLVDAEMDLYASRWMTLEALWNADQRGIDPAAAAVVQLYVLNAAWRSIDEVLQVFGGIGFTQDMPIEAMWRHIRIQQDRLGGMEAARQQVAAALTI